MAFENLIGNETNKQLLKKIVEIENVLHSYMFVGQSGIGKLAFAKEFAKMILCEKHKEKYCKTCKSCMEFESYNHPDFKIIEPDGKSIKVEQIRNLIEKIIEKPIISDKKVYIINDSDKMTEEAQNSLLKTLEESYPYVVIILIVENENLILSTIKSRCTKIFFNNIPEPELKKILKEKFDIKDLSENLIKVFNGSLKKTENIKENIRIYKEVEKIIINIDNISKIDLLNKKNVINSNEEYIFEILDYINILFYEKLLKEKDNLKYLNRIKAVDEAKKSLNKNNNFNMTIDKMIMEITKEI